MGGRVTYSDDGAPVTVGFVVFATPTYQSRGIIKSDGTYTLSSTGNNDGIPKGEYAVYLIGVEKDTQIVRSDGSYITRSELLISEKFTSPETSDLKCVIDGKEKTFDIIVDRFVNPGGRR